MENIQMTAEELAAEQTAIQEVKEDDIRSEVISKYGLDEIDNADLINSLVADRVESHKKLSKAIGQKIKLREELKSKSEVKPQIKDDKKVVDPDEVERLLEEKLNKRDLDSIDLPDNIKEEIKNISKIKGISIKQAQSDSYIKFLVDSYEKTKQETELVDKAAISKTNKQSAKKTFSIDVEPDCDMTTEEGRKTWDEYTEFLKNHPKFK